MSNCAPNSRGTLLVGREHNIENIEIVLNFLGEIQELVYPRMRLSKSRVLADNALDVVD
jgi:hypothetical protein